MFFLEKEKIKKQQLDLFLSGSRFYSLYKSLKNSPQERRSLEHLIRRPLRSCRNLFLLSNTNISPLKYQYKGEYGFY